MGPVGLLSEPGSGNYKAVVAPDFPGYKIEIAGGKVSSTEVLRNRQQWEEARKELGVDENGRRRRKAGWESCLSDGKFLNRAMLCR